MARRIGDNTRPVMLTADAARRVARAVQGYEHARRPSIKAARLRTAASDDGEPLRMVRVDEAWPKDTSRAVQLIYERDCDIEDDGSGSGSGSGEDTLEEVYNRLFDIPAHAIVYIGMARNGCWHVVAAGCGWGGSGSESGSESGSGDCPCVSIGGEDLTTVSGYDANATQVLAHENGCLKWISTTDCGSGSS